MFATQRTPIGTALVETQDGGSEENDDTKSTEHSPDLEEAEMKIGAEVHDEVHGRIPADSEGYEHVRNEVET